MDAREADRKTIIDIVSEMQTTTHSVKCLDIEREAIKRGISKPTFYRRLMELAKEGILEKGKVSHRDIRYRVNFQRMPEEQAKVVLFKRYVLNKLDLILQQIAQKNDEQELIKELAKWIGALSLFSLMKQIQTGLPYTDAVTYYITEPKGAPRFIRGKIVYSSGVIWQLEKDRGKLEKAMIDEPLGEGFKTEVDYFFEVMQRLFPIEFDEFNQGLETNEMELHLNQQKKQ
jgi:Fe2+ or Zn2+ uptake regulation protein